MREKLIALIQAAVGGCSTYWAGVIAGHLIANGVTIQRWIPVTERLPVFYPGRERSVLVTLEDHKGKRLVTTAKYSREWNEWCEFKDYRYTEFKVLAWMPKPERYEPPKGE